MSPGAHVWHRSLQKVCRCSYSGRISKESGPTSPIRKILALAISVCQGKIHRMRREPEDRKAQYGVPFMVCGPTFEIHSSPSSPVFRLPEVDPNALPAYQDLNMLKAAIIAISTWVSVAVLPDAGIAQEHATQDTGSSAPTGSGVGLGSSPMSANNFFRTAACLASASVRE